MRIFRATEGCLTVRTGPLAAFDACGMSAG